MGEEKDQSALEKRTGKGRAKGRRKETEARSKAEFKAGSKDEFKAVSKAESKAGSKVESKGESKAGSKADSKAAFKADSKAEFKAEPKADSEAESKAEAGSEAEVGKAHGGKKSRRDQSWELFQESKADFLCPECRENLILDQQGSFRCKKGHCFDLSAKGYVNFIPGQKPVNYGKELFEYRQRVFEQGFYQSAAEEIEEILIRRLGLSDSWEGTASYGKAAASSKKEKRNKTSLNSEKKAVLSDLQMKAASSASEKKVILDVGCGEGYYSRWLVRSSESPGLSPERPQRFSESPGLSEACRFFSMDIAKDAIRLAAQKGEGLGLMIADLARLPLKRNRVDALLNILTPANYQEFFRVLKPDGFLIKVIPGSQYLREVRNAVSQQLIHKEYSNQSVMEYFREHAELLERRTVLQTFPVDEETAGAFFRMTPMTGQVDFSKVRQEDMKTITIHLEILVGRPRR